MKQPDLGLKVAELRQQKGMTQEQLAEYCDVSTRTIQRIETGEVEPRAFTRNNLNNALDFEFGDENTSNETLWLALLHLTSILSNIIIALLIWSWKKGQSYRIDKQGRDVLNFQITVTLMLVGAGLFGLIIFSVTTAVMIKWGESAGAWGTAMFLAGLLPLIAIGVFTTYQGIANAIRVLADKPYRYPLSIQFIK
jgi:uncharacterized Tic20 family protein